MKRKIILISVILIFSILIYSAANIPNLDKKVSLNVFKAPVGDVLRMISAQNNINIFISANVQGEITLKVKDIPLKNLLQSIFSISKLKGMWNNGILMVVPENDKLTQEMQTKIYTLKYVSGEQIKPIIEGIIGENGDVFLLTEEENEESDNSTNYNLSTATPATKLVVRTTPDMQKKIENVINDIDVVKKQIFISAKIIEITNNTSNTWNNVIKIDNSFQDISIKSTYGKEPTEKEGGLSFQIGTISTNRLNILIDKLLQKTNSNLLSRPYIMAQDNKIANILVGEEVPYKETTSSSSGGETETSSTVSFKQVGINLAVIPHVVGDFINLKLHQEVSEVMDKNVEGIPRIATRSTDTEITIRNGSTIVLGGLIKNNDIDTEKRLPFLSDIPVIGKFFTSKDKQHSKTELIVFITAHIYTGETEKNEK